MSEAVVTLAIQLWKLCAAFERELAFAPAERLPAAEAQLRFTRRKLDTVLADEGMSLATYDGAAWGLQIPAGPVNPDEVAPGALAIVDTTIEPTLVGQDGVVHPGKVLLKKGTIA